MKNKRSYPIVHFGDVAQSITYRMDNPAESVTNPQWGAPTDVEPIKLPFEPGDITFGRRCALHRFRS